MPDLAKLVIAIDHSQVSEGDKKLGAMASTADRAEASLTKMNKVFVGLGVAAGVGIAAKQLYTTNTEFERLNTSLVTVTKSQVRANQVFGELQGFAAATPFALREVTEAYIMMRARGLDPTTQTMTSLGNLASGMGRSFQDTIGAVGSLAAGEIEPMKQLGFSVMTIGDKVRLSSGGVSETVQKNAYDISKAVARIADVKFAGGMERQIETLGGAWSNLGDQVDATLYKIGQEGFNENLRKGMQDLTRSINDATPAMAHFASETVSGSMSAVKWIGEHQRSVLALGAAYMTLKGGMAYGSAVAEFSSPRGGADAGIGSQVRGMTDYVRALRMAKAEELGYAENEVRSTAAAVAAAEAQIAKSRATNFVIVKRAEELEMDQAYAIQQGVVTAALEARAAAEARMGAASAAGSGVGLRAGEFNSSADLGALIAQNKLQSAAATEREAASELRLLAVKREKGPVDFQAVALQRTIQAQELQVAMTTEAHTAALAKQAIAQNANTAASTAGSLAGKGFSAVVTALGGPVGAITTGLVLAGTAAYLWGDKMKSSAQTASEEADKYLVRLREEVALLDRKQELAGKGRTGEAGMDDATIKALQAKEKYAGELQVKLADAQRFLSGYNKNDTSDVYIYVLQREQEAQAELNRITAEYNEIALGAQRVKNVGIQKSAEAKAASEADAKLTAENARKEMEQQKQAQEALKTLEERKSFMKDLRKDNVIGSAVLASGTAGAEMSKADEEIAKLEAQAKRLGIAGNELAAIYERSSQIRQKARAEQWAKDAQSSFDRDAQEAASYSEELANLRQEYDLLGASIEKQVRYKAADLGLTEEQIQAQIKLRTEMEGVQYAMSLDNEENRAAKRALEEQKLNENLQANIISTKAYARRMGELKIEGSVMLQSFSYGLEGIGQTGADAFGRWAAGMDGAALSGKKLFQQLIADMARMQAQKGWSQLIDLGISAIGGWSNVGTAPGGGARIDYGSGSPSSGGPLNFGPIPGAAQGGASGQGLEFVALPVQPVSQGQPSITSQITVNIAQDGTATTKATSSDGNNLARELQRQVEPLVAQSIQKFMRPGGMMNPTGSRS